MVAEPHPTSVGSGSRFSTDGARVLAKKGGSGWILRNFVVVSMFLFWNVVGGWGGGGGRGAGKARVGYGKWKGRQPRWLQRSAAMCWGSRCCRICIIVNSLENSKSVALLQWEKYIHNHWVGEKESYNGRHLCYSFQPAPFFVLDEIDAALDNTNIGKVNMPNFRTWGRIPVPVFISIFSRNNRRTHF